MIWTLFSQLVIDTSVPLLSCLRYASPSVFMFTHNDAQNELSGHYIEALKILTVKHKVFVAIVMLFVWYSVNTGTLQV